MDKFTEKLKNISRRWRLCGCGDVCRCWASRVSRRVLNPGGQRRNCAPLVKEEADENPPTLEGKNIIGGDGKPRGMETAVRVPPSRLDAHSGYLNPIAELLHADSSKRIGGRLATRCFFSDDAQSNPRILMRALSSCRVL